MKRTKARQIYGAAIRRWRHRNNIRQKELCHMLGTGATNVYKIEKALSFPTFETALRIYAITGIAFSEIMQEMGDEVHEVLRTSETMGSQKQ